MGQLGRFFSMQHVCCHLGRLCSPGVYSRAQCEGTAATWGRLYSWRWQQLNRTIPTEQAHFKHLGPLASHWPKQIAWSSSDWRGRKEHSPSVGGTKVYGVAAEWGTEAALKTQGLSKVSRNRACGSQAMPYWLRLWMNWDLSSSFKSATSELWVIGKVSS